MLWIKLKFKNISKKYFQTSQIPYAFSVEKKPNNGLIKIMQYIYA